MSPRTALITPRTLQNLAPLDLLRRWPRDRALVMLHSGRVHPQWARWSILAPPQGWYVFDQQSRWMSSTPSPIDQVTFAHDPLRDLDAIIAATSTKSKDEHRLPFCGGWIGNFSYDLGRVIEPKAQFHSHAALNQAWPLIQLAWCPDALIFDHTTHTWHTIGDCADLIEELLANQPLCDDHFELGELRATIPPEQYMQMVQRAIDYIAAGDIFQANIAQQFTATFENNPRALARTAFERNQPWYGAYLEIPPLPLGEGRGEGVLDIGAVGDCGIVVATCPHPSLSQRERGTIISLSPELFLQVDARSGRVITRPIKGTRPATSSPRELERSEKDTAELNMIIDLMRNDLGRVCEIGSIRIANPPRAIESHPTIHHGVGEVQGTLRRNVTIADLLRATFPGGSVTGAPKIRAMQIIDELESPPLGGIESRGPYCGAIGSISNTGNITLNIAIRTMLLSPSPSGGGRGIKGEGSPHHNPSALNRQSSIVNRQSILTYSAGAGIVADSSPQREYQETLDKTAALRGLINHERAS